MSGKVSADKIVWCSRGWNPVYFGFCPSETAWRREMRRMNIDPASPYPDTDGRTSHFQHDGKHVVLVTLADRVQRSLKVVPLAGLIAHEAVHVWQIVCEVMQEEDPSREFEAYSIQVITQELYWALLDVRKARKRKKP